MKQTQNPGAHEAPSQKRSSNPEAAEATAMQQVMELLNPLLEFHKPVDSATDDDLRLYWDVRLVRGRDTPFAQSTGTTTLHCALTYKMIMLTPSRIRQDIQDKIAMPLTARVQDEADRVHLQEVPRGSDGSGFDGEEPESAGDGES